MAKTTTQKRTIDARGYFRETIIIDGKRYDRRAKTNKELDEKILSLRLEHAQGHLITDKSLTVEKWTFQWMDVYKKNSVDASTYKMYEINIRVHILPYIGKMKLVDVAPIHIQNILEKSKGKSKSTIDKLRLTLKQIFNQACVNRLITYNPTQGMIIPSAAVKIEKHVLTDNEQNAFVKTAITHRAGIYVLFMLCCGLRNQEVIPLTWNDIDFEAQEVIINKAVQYSEEQASLKETKTKNSNRRVNIPDVLFELLLKNRKEDGLLFTPANSEKLLSRIQRDRLFDSYLRAADIEAGAELYRNKIIQSKLAHHYNDSGSLVYDITPHCLRHTYATNLYKYGVDLKTAQLLLGHADIKTTANIYTHEDKKKKREAAVALKNIYKLSPT
ncbi:MAG: tyrosine-type recombinase/integrase [Eubacteriales bacterium]